ncbi:MAG: YiiD C-terminal domain-containing protein [Gammaproteobacteria bacterium]
MKDALHAYLADAIPLYGAMQATVSEADSGSVTLVAPLGPNTNHQSTAFGGSVASLATLACWGWLWGLLREAGIDARLVVARSEIDYLKPVLTSLNAKCDAPGAAATRAFLDGLTRKGRARIELEAVVTNDTGMVCARFTGRFVASAVG